MLPAPAVSLSLEGISLHGFNCTVCGYSNMLSTIPIDNICRCKMCNNTFNIGEISRVVARVNNNNFGLMLPPIEGLSDEENRRRQWVIGVVGIVMVSMVVILAMQMFR